MSMPSVPGAYMGAEQANGLDPATAAKMERSLGIGDPVAEAASLERDRRAGEERAVAEVQAATEGVTLAEKIEFGGQWFRIGSKVGLMPLMKFAHAAKSQVDTSDMDALAAIYEILQDCIMAAVPPCGKCGPCTSNPPRMDQCPYADAGDWGRFERHAVDTHADAEELLPVVTQVIERLTARPTRRP